VKIQAQIVENYLTQDECLKLISDLDRYVDWKNVANIHNGRLSLPNSDPIFQMLLDKSRAWQEFYSKIYSQKFLDEVHRYFENKSNKPKLNFFPLLSKKRPQWFNRVTENSSTPLKFSSKKKLFSYFLVRVLFSPYIKLRILLCRFTGINLPVDILFDVSKANHGYAREIHRDSDSRLYVFLIYFNDLDYANYGGELLLYKYKGDLPPKPQPSEEECELIQSLTPKSGRLVIFKNDDYAFHAVSEMQKMAGYRYFCYGGFTSMRGCNPFIKFTKSQFKTTFHQYL
jgi:Rps23 Pro-64 3,4-dihydroxylase Tpa1-like proline 4-hydroxylase